MQTHRAWRPGMVPYPKEALRTYISMIHKISTTSSIFCEVRLIDYAGGVSFKAHPKTKDTYMYLL